MNRYLKIILLLLFISLLFLIRAFSAELFYDPLIEYFKNDYLYTKMPQINIWHLVIDMLYRYLLNSLTTLAIIWLLFNKTDYLKFTGFFLMAAFVVLIVVFALLLRNQFKIEGFDQNRDPIKHHLSLLNAVSCCTREHCCEEPAHLLYKALLPSLETIASCPELVEK